MYLQLKVTLHLCIVLSCTTTSEITVDIRNNFSHRKLVQHKKKSITINSPIRCEKKARIKGRINEQIPAQGDTDKCLTGVMTHGLSQQECSLICFLLRLPFYSCWLFL